MDLGWPEIVLILIAILVLFGYKKLPDASRSIGRSLRIFKGEMKGMRDDDTPAQDPRGKGAAATTPVRGEVLPPTTPAVNIEARLQQEARAAEAPAAELRARAAQARTQQSRMAD